MVLAWLLARAGVDVIVLEKHADFFRDFRGDTADSSLDARADVRALRRARRILASAAHPHGSPRSRHPG